MNKSFRTFLKHTAKDYYNQSVNPPVVRASTIIFKTMNELRKTQKKGLKNPIGGHFEYGRQGTSTTFILQQMLREMEECYHVFLTPTGFGSVFLSIFSGDDGHATSFIIDNNCNTLLHVRQNKETMEYLLDKGGDPNRENLDLITPVTTAFVI